MSSLLDTAKLSICLARLSIRIFSLSSLLSRRFLLSWCPLTWTGLSVHRSCSLTAMILEIMSKHGLLLENCSLDVNSALNSALFPSHAIKTVFPCGAYPVVSNALSTTTIEYNPPSSARKELSLFGGPGTIPPPMASSPCENWMIHAHEQISSSGE